MSYEPGGGSVDRYDEVDQVDDKLEEHGWRVVENDGNREKKNNRRVKFKRDGGTKDDGDMSIEDEGGRVHSYGGVGECDENLQGQGGEDVESGSSKQHEITQRMMSKAGDRIIGYGDWGFEDDGRVGRYDDVDQRDDLQAQGERGVESGGSKENEIMRRMKSKHDRTEQTDKRGFEDDGGRVDRYGGASQGGDDLMGSRREDVESSGGEQKEIKRRRRSRGDDGTQDCGDVGFEDGDGRDGRYGDVDQGDDDLEHGGGNGKDGDGYPDVKVHLEADPILQDYGSSFEVADGGHKSQGIDSRLDDADVGRSVHDGVEIGGHGVEKFDRGKNVPSDYSHGFEEGGGLADHYGDIERGDKGPQDDGSKDVEAGGGYHKYIQCIADADPQEYCSSLEGVGRGDEDQRVDSGLVDANGGCSVSGGIRIEAGGRGVDNFDGGDTVLPDYGRDFEYSDGLHGKCGGVYKADVRSLDSGGWDYKAGGGFEEGRPGADASPQDYGPDIKGVGRGYKDRTIDVRLDDGESTLLGHDELEDASHNFDTCDGGDDLPHHKNHDFGDSGGLDNEHGKVHKDYDVAQDSGSRDFEAGGGFEDQEGQPGAAVCPQDYDGGFKGGAGGYEDQRIDGGLDGADVGPSVDGGIDEVGNGFERFGGKDIAGGAAGHQDDRIGFEDHSGLVDSPDHAPQDYAGGSFDDGGIDDYSHEFDDTDYDPLDYTSF